MGATIVGRAAPHKRELGTAAMRPLQMTDGCVPGTGPCDSRPSVMPGAAGPKAFWQKKRPHPKMGPYDRTEVQIRSWWQMDEGGGIRHLPGGYRSREEDTTSTRLPQTRT